MPHHKLRVTAVTWGEAVPQNEAGLQLRRALLKYFEVVGAVMDQKGTWASCVRLALNASPCSI